MEVLLAIDTCGAEGGVAVADAATGAVLASRTLAGRQMQEQLMPALEAVLAEANASCAEIAVVAVSHGPGSFTGVRIGLAAAKGLAEALGAPLVALSRLELLAGKTDIAEPNPWLDAGRGEVYVGVYRQGNAVREALTERAVAQALPGVVVVCEDALRGEGTWVQAPSVEDLVRASFNAWKAGRTADPLTLDANYLRKPDAQLALEARG